MFSSMSSFDNIALTRCAALLDMVIQAGTVLSDVFWQIPAAGADLIQLLDQFNRIFHCSARWYTVQNTLTCLSSSVVKTELSGNSSSTVTLI